jgi:GDP-4-dehydro-6-deoxy-D-mannose reductase
LKVLVTGAGGFVGRHLTTTLARQLPHWVLDAPCGADGRTVLDVTDAEAVNAWIAQAQPDVVVHLAAVAAVTAAVRDPRTAWRVNLNGSLNIVLAMQALAPEAHLLYVSSAEVYGRSLDAPQSVDERALLEPVNPYAASKAAADILVRQASAEGLPATVMRPFNHIGVGQSEAFAAPSFAAQIARIEAGLQAPVLEVGSLEEERDFLDVQDVVDAYVLVMERRDDARVRGAFNVASGVAVAIGDILDRLLSLAKVPIEVRVDRSRLRHAPIRRVVGDSARLRSIGWSPKASLDHTLADILDYWRQTVAIGQGDRTR